MARHFLVAVCSLCMVVRAAPPAPPRLYQHVPAHLQNIQSLGYYADNEIGNFYNQQAQAQQKQGNLANGAPARLETLEPDSEVELIPGAQQPQQPPQQAPVAPNIPGLAPGQRVFIVHMPIPGYRPGTVSGYQPVYIVAAAPQGNAGYPAPNGYQNAILVNPGVTQGYSPFLGYPGLGQIGTQSPAGLVVGPYNRPLYPYQEQGFGYHQPNLQGAAGQAPGNLSPLEQAHLANPARNAGVQANAANQDPKRIGESTNELLDSIEIRDMVEQRPGNDRAPGPKVNRMVDGRIILN